MTSSVGNADLMALGPTLRVEKKPNGKLKVEGLRIWSVGTFHGYGSPPEGDTFTHEDLDRMVEAFRELKDRVDPRIYPGHPLNPLLKLFARPKGRIANLRRDGDYLVADLDDVDPDFWQKAMEDGARLSPDIKFGHRDPKTGKHYPFVLMGLGVLGAAPPANTLLPSLDSYVSHYYTAAYGEGEVRSYAFPFKGFAEGKTHSRPAEIPPEKRDEYDIPDHVFLWPEEKRYPVKRRIKGEWKYSKADLRDAYRLASLHCKRKGGKHCEVAQRAKELLEGEFGKGTGSNIKEDGVSYTEGGTMELAELKAMLEEALKAEDETLRGFAEKLQALERTLSKELEERKALEEELAKARAILEAKLVEEALQEIRGFVDGLVAQGKLPPALREEAELVLQTAAGVGGTVGSYALGDPGDKAGLSLYELLRSFLGRLPEVAPRPIPKDQKAYSEELAFDALAYSHRLDRGVAGQAGLIRQRAEALMKERGVSYAEALKEVIRSVSK